MVINDEAHHIFSKYDGAANTNDTKKWYDFISDSVFDFKYVVGLSGTCYIGNDYFPDVIYRYSLKKAIEEDRVKQIEYIAEQDNGLKREDKLRLVLESHNEIKLLLKDLETNILPITIFVSHKTVAADKLALKFAEFLRNEFGYSEETIKEKWL